MYVGGLEVEEVEEGGVVHGGRGPRRGDSRGIGGEAVCEGGLREDAGARRGKRSGEDAGRERLWGGPELGLAQSARRGGSERAGVLGRTAGCRGVLGRRCEYENRCLIRTRAGWQRRSWRDVAGPRGCSTREGRQSCGRSLVGATRRARRGRQEAGRRDRRPGCRGVRGRLELCVRGQLLTPERSLGR